MGMLSAVFGGIGTVLKIISPHLKFDSDKENQRKERRYTAFCNIEAITKRKVWDRHAIAQLEMLYPVAGIKGLSVQLAEDFHEYITLTDLRLDGPEATAFLKCSNMLTFAEGCYSLDKGALKSARRSLNGGLIALVLIPGIFMAGVHWLINDTVKTHLPSFFFPVLAAVFVLLVIAYFNGSQKERQVYTVAEAFSGQFAAWQQERVRQRQKKASNVQSLINLTAVGFVTGVGLWLVRRKWKI